MPMFVHITSEDIARKVRRSGVKPPKSKSRPLRGVFAMPVTPNFQVTHQWTREVKQWRHGTMVGVYFRIPDDELVLVGRYDEEPRSMTAAEAVAHVMAQTTMTGVEVLVPRAVLPKEIVRIRKLPQLVGWRHYPEAHGKHPWSCPCCQRDSFGSRKIRQKFAEATASA